MASSTGSSQRRACRHRVRWPGTSEPDGPHQLRLRPPLAVLVPEVRAQPHHAQPGEAGLQAEAEPDSLCRVLNLFALQFLTPHHVQVSQQDDWLAIEIGIGGLSWHRAEVIAQKLRNLVCVGDVSLANLARVELAVV